jgi:hypothetical protein
LKLHHYTLVLLFVGEELFRQVINHICEVFDSLAPEDYDGTDLQIDGFLVCMRALLAVLLPEEFLEFRYVELLRCGIWGALRIGPTYLRGHLWHPGRQVGHQLMQACTHKLGGEPLKQVSLAGYTLELGLLELVLKVHIGEFKLVVVILELS